jgi:plastocyanin
MVKADMVGVVVFEPIAPATHWFGTWNMKLLKSLLLAGALGFGFTGWARAQATLEGVVKAPSLPATAPALNQRYQSKGAENLAAPEQPVAVVYLEGQFPAPASPPKAEMGQKHLQFGPGLLVVQKGTTVEFPNYDDFYHNVFSYSKPKRFDLGRYLKTEKPAAQVLDQPGTIKLFCEIHDHMRGTILVVDTPHFQKCATNGTYKLENLPAGKFVLKAWVNEKTTCEKPVELKAGETLKVDFP